MALRATLTEENATLIVEERCDSVDGMNLKAA
jgi:hypothetical protein